MPNSSPEDQLVTTSSPNPVLSEIGPNLPVSDADELLSDAELSKSLPDVYALLEKEGVKVKWKKRILKIKQD